MVWKSPWHSKYMVDETKNYPLYRLWSIDIENALYVLGYASNEDLPKVIRYALLRDAVVSYSKPFVQFRSLPSLKKKGFVPKEYKQIHEKLLEFRNKVICHTDESFRSPKFMKYGTDFFMSFRSSNNEYLIENLNLIISLLKCVEKNLNDEIEKQRKIILKSI